MKKCHFDKKIFIKIKNGVFVFYQKNMRVLNTLAVLGVFDKQDKKYFYLLRAKSKIFFLARVHEKVFYLVYQMVVNRLNFALLAEKVDKKPKKCFLSR